MVSADRLNCKNFHHGGTEDTEKTRNLSPHLNGWSYQGIPFLKRKVRGVVFKHPVLLTFVFLRSSP